MQYLGGKSRIGRKIAYVVNRIRQPGQPYWEPFCGSCWVTIHVHGAPRYCSDACYELIEMWRALQDGWTPPTVVTEMMYYEAKAGKYDAALRGFIGFGCSFGGKWFAGYARGVIDNYAQTSAGSVLWQIGQLQDVTFSFADYKAPAPADGMLIYADPPYVGTTDYKGAAFPFDTAEFWQVCRQWVQDGHAVLVSEYDAPPDFPCVREIATSTMIRTAANGCEPRIERLFMHESQAHLYRANVPQQMELML